MKKIIFFILLLLSTISGYAAIIDSLRITPSIDEQTFKNGRLEVSYHTHGNSNVSYQLLDAEGQVVAEGLLAKAVKPGHQQAVINVTQVNRWTANTPYLYTLCLNATPTKGKAQVLQCVKQKVGFRLVAIRYAKLFLNGCPLFLKGINLHHMNKGMSRAEMINILRVLKAHHINAVHTDSTNPLWYDLCDEYGFYACADLGQDPNANTFNMLYNHPSIVMWSVAKAEANNAAVSALFAKLKQTDAQRPVMWPDLPFTDERCELYSPFAPTAKVADDFCNMTNPVAEKPQLLASYASAQGNSYGAIDEYMSLHSRQPRYAGGFLCEGTLDNMLKGMPAMQEISYQMQSISTLSQAPRVGKIEVFNDSFYETLSNVTISWVVRYNGAPVLKGQYTKPFTVAPRKTTRINLGYADLFKTYPIGQLTLDVTYHQSVATPLINKGQTVAKAQIVVRPFKADALPVPDVADANPSKLKLKRGQDIITIANNVCTVSFNKATGWLTRYDAFGHAMLADGGTLKPNFWRPLTSNDRAADGEKMFGPWQDPTYTLVSLTTEKVKNPDTQRTEVCVTAQYELKAQRLQLAITYTLNEQGALQVSQKVTPHDATAQPKVLRYGMTLQMPKSMSQSQYFGRGPEENYADRKASQFVGLYQFDAAQAQCPYEPYQAWGNHCDVRRWCQTNAQGQGLEVSSAATFSASAHASAEIASAEASSAKPLSAINLNIDLKQSGVNEMTNVGQYPEMINDTRVLLHEQTFTFCLTPIGGTAEKQ